MMGGKYRTSTRRPRLTVNKDNDRMLRDLSTIMQRNTVTNMGLGAILREQQAQTAGVLWMQDMFNCVLSILSDRESMLTIYADE